MAVQGRGYYGIGTARKDFGFSSNMTLPLAGGYNLAQAGGMPQERHSGKGHASFAVEKERKVRWLEFSMLQSLAPVLRIICMYTITLLAPTGGD